MLFYCYNLTFVATLREACRRTGHIYFAEVTAPKSVPFVIVVAVLRGDAKKKITEGIKYYFEA